MTTNSQLPATAYAVLGILAFGHELSGYELRQWSLGVLRHFYWSPAQSQIYRELQRLGDAGYARSREVSQDGRPDKTLYAITSNGRDALAFWVPSQPVDDAVLKHHPALRIFLSAGVPAAELVALLEAHRDKLLLALDDLETQSVAMGADPDTLRSALVCDWAAEIHRGDLRGTEAVLKALTNSNT